LGNAFMDVVADLVGKESVDAKVKKIVKGLFSRATLKANISKKKRTSLHQVVALTVRCQHRSFSNQQAVRRAP
jgi:hypothetical protein